MTPIFRGLTAAAAWSLVGVVVSIVVVLAWESAGAMRTFGWSFLTIEKWDPVANEYGALPFIYGTLVSSLLLALLQAVPLGIGTALFLSEMAPAWLRAPVSFLVELLAAIPSVVYGLWGIFVLVPWARNFIQPRPRRHPRLPAASFRAELRRRHADGVDHPRRHDRAVHHVGRARGLPHRADGATRGRARSRRHPLGDDPHGRPSVRPRRGDRRHHARARTRARRDDGGHHGDREPARDRALVLRPGSTMASVIANEFSEASSELYVQVLVEIGLVLLAVTMLVNISSPACWCGASATAGGGALSHVAPEPSHRESPGGRGRRRAARWRCWCRWC